jgi:phosphoglycolate phosphatase (TIGR01487 family)
MRYRVLAVDYDGTLATDGKVFPQAVAALEEVRASGRQLILVTGRELPELLEIFPQIEVFDRVVAENGALLYRPATKESEVLAPPASEPLVEELRKRRVEPLSVGATIVATLKPNATTVLEAIEQLGLEMQVIFNKSAAMVLPANVNKASGLMAALEELGLSAHNVVAIGDGENDHAMLQLAEYSAAVANAIPALREAADRTTRGSHGKGVIELIEDLVATDLQTPHLLSQRRAVQLGTRETGRPVTLPPAGISLLVAGSSGSGKSSLATGMLERLAAQGYQFCVVDPEGDYEAFPGAIVFGSSERAPSIAEIGTALAKPAASIVVNLVSLPLQDRPEFFASLLPRLFEMRAKTGRPHWILVDETHHLLPSDWQPAPMILPEELTSMIYVTVHPESVAPAVLSRVDVVAALGAAPDKAIRSFCKAVEASQPPLPEVSIGPGKALLWMRRSRERPFVLDILPGQTDRRRHRRKYAEGELPPERSFFFRGPDEALNLRAQNLVLFMQVGDGVDDRTWLHHLYQGDYSKWMKSSIKDDVLADEVRAIEGDEGLSPAESRRQVRAAIEKHYTLPAREGGVVSLQR